MKFREIKIKEDFIRLDSAMKLASFVATGGYAKILIKEGLVRVNGEICTMRGKKLHKGDNVEYEDNGFTVV